MSANVSEEQAAHSELNDHQAPHTGAGVGDTDLDIEEILDEAARSQSYAQVASNTKTLELHLAREDKSNDYYVSYAEAATLVFKRLNVPEGMLMAIDNTPYKKLIIELDGSVNISQLNLTQALEVRRGLKTRPLQSPDTDREIRITRAPMKMDNEEIKNVLRLFGEITYNIRHVVLEPSAGAAPDSWQVLMRGVKTAERTLRMKVKTNIPSFIMVLGTKLKVDYAGQPKTCPRCQKYWAMCPGSGKVDKCKKNGGEEKDCKVSFKSLVNRLKKKEKGEGDIEPSAPLVPGYIPNPDQITFSNLPEDMDMDGFAQWLDEKSITFLASMCFKGNKPGTFIISSYEDDNGEMVHLNAGEAQDIVTKLHGVEHNKKRVMVQMEALSTPSKRKPEVVHLDDSGENSSQVPPAQPVAAAGDPILPNPPGPEADKKAAVAVARKERRKEMRQKKKEEKANKAKDSEKGKGNSENDDVPKAAGEEGDDEGDDEGEGDESLKLVISSQFTHGGTKTMKVRNGKRANEHDSSVSSDPASPKLPNNTQKKSPGVKGGKKPKKKIKHVL